MEIEEEKELKEQLKKLRNEIIIEEQKLKDLCKGKQIWSEWML